MQTNPSAAKDKYGQRRKAIKDTFLQSLTAIPDVEARFVVGRSSNREANRAFSQELKQNPGLYMNLDMEVSSCFERTLHHIPLARGYARHTPLSVTLVVGQVTLYCWMVLFYILMPSCRHQNIAGISAQEIYSIFFHLQFLVLMWQD